MYSTSIQSDRLVVSYLKAKVMDLMDLYILVGVSVLLIVLPKLLQNYKSKLPHPPGPRGLPFIGNLHQIDVSILPHYLWKLSRQYGPIMYLRLGYLPVLVISNSEMAKLILKTHDLNFCSRPSLFGLRKVSYNYRDVVFSPYNEYWREMRKIVTIHLFSSKRIQSFRSIREEEVFLMIKGISEKASSNEVLNLTQILVPLANTIVCRLAFGKKFDEASMKRFEVLLARFQAVTAAFYFSDIFPMFARLDRLTGSSAELDRFFMDMDLFYQELIEEHLVASRPSSMEGDVIDILLQLKRDDQLSSIDFTIDNIKAIIMVKLSICFW